MTTLDRILDAAADNLRIAKILVQMGLDPNNITYDALFNRLLEIVLANITLANMFALVGVIFFVATLLTQTMVPLRVANMIGCMFFAIFGALTGAITTFLLYLMMIPINAYRLRQMLILVKKARSATKGDTSLEWLKPFMTERKYRKGDVLFRKDDAAHEMLLTVTGKFLVKEISVELPPGQLMGEFGFLTPDNRRTATIECIEDGHVLTITYEKLLEIYFQNPQFGYYFLVLTSQRLLENIARLEAVVAQNKALAAVAAAGGSHLSSEPPRRPRSRLFRRGPQFDLFGAHGAELEFRNLAERVERRVGQQVRRRFRVAERHEHHVFRHVAVGAHLDLDRAAAGLQLDEIAGPDAHAPHVLWRHERHRLRLDLVEHAGAAGHRAGVPVLEHAAGRQHHRIFVVGHFVGRDHMRRHDLAAAASRSGNPW